MTAIIHGSKPISFPASGPQSSLTLRTVYHLEGQECIVPDGMVLVVKEHGRGLDSSPEIRHQFPAGTRFVVLVCGDPYTPSVTQILD